LVRGDRSRLAATGVRTISGALGDAALPAELFPSEPHVLLHLANKRCDDRRGLAQSPAHAEQLVESLPPQCRGILYASHSSIYGPGAHDRVSESAAERPDSAFAKSRLATERVLTNAARERGISAIMLRPHFIVGHGDRHFLPTLARLVSRGIGVGSGQQAY